MMLAAIGNPFIPDWASLRPFAAELWLLVGIVGVLLTPFWSKKSNAISGLVALGAIVAAFVTLLVVDGRVIKSPAAGVFTATTPAVSVGTAIEKSDAIGEISGHGKVRADADGTVVRVLVKDGDSVAIGQPLLEIGAVQLRGMLLSDGTSFFWKAILLLFVGGVVLMWFTTTAATMHEGDGPEFFTLLLGATIGMCLMACTSNLLMIFMAVEMASLPSYVLAGFRKTDRMGSEASLKYVVFGAATSAIMVYGLSLLYGMYGTLQLEVLAQKLWAAENVLAYVALLCVAVGIGFKISAVPLHFWCPDVFEGAGVDVAAFLSVASKGAGLMLLLRIVMSIAGSVSFMHSSMLVGLAITIGVIGTVTATVGNTAAFVQTNIKRLLAYSSIAHAGYMLCALSLLLRGAAQGVDPAQAVSQAILIYLAVYLFMNLGAFTVAGLIYRETGSENIEDYAGMSRRNPLLALCMAVFMFSLVGLPPFAGFVAKLNVMYVLARSGGWWWALVAVIGINTIFSLYYYARVVRTMYLVPSDRAEIPANPAGVGLSVICAGMLVAMLVAFNPLFRMTERYSRGMLLPKAGRNAPAATTPETGQERHLADAR